MADSQDTEITLGTGRLLGLFFGLVVVCAVFFGLGFSLGRNSVKAGALTMEETPAASANSNAAAKTMAGTPEKVVPVAATDTPVADATSTASQSAPAPTVVSSAPAVTNIPAPEMAKPLSATISGNGYTVQVAAVSKEEDADALVDALKKKSYPVFVASAAADKLFHVQVGPFGDIKDAEAMKAKLLGDGYNPIVKR
jgi:cell division septation protein DedD